MEYILSGHRAQEQFARELKIGKVMIVKKGVKELVEEAEEQVVTLTPAEVDDKSQGGGV
ncbi:MAG: hypothetical protein CM1200mP40_11350 [Gammaproteobacteria bacterium]|nr:MAG: hypothetical protein CM1200mP40_11350 [Gammaproteobacteria bacterium]